MWSYETVFYQIYPMGFCNASFENDGICRRNIKEFADWSGHLAKPSLAAELRPAVLGVSAIPHPSDG